MKKLTIVLLFILIVPILAFGQSIALLELYEIPTYEYRSITLHSPYLFDYSSIEYPDQNRKTTTFRSNLQLDEEVIKQSPKSTIRYSGFGVLEYTSSETKVNGNTTEDQDLFSFTALMAGTRQTYFGDERGLFYHLGFGLGAVYDFTNSFFAKVYEIPIGLGYGRIIGVKNVVQAYIISDELGAELSDTKLMELAEVIEKYNNDYYEAENRDDAEIVFYNDIAAITGKPENAMKISQILNSHIYKTSARYVGWEAKASIVSQYAEIGTYNYNYFGYTLAYDFQASLLMSLEYAFPIELNKQLFVSAYYLSPFGDENSNRKAFGLSGSFTIDHNYHWSSALTFDYVSILPDVGDKLTNLAFSLGTDYLITNAYSISASIDFANDPEHRFFPGVLEIDKARTPSVLQVEQWLALAGFTNIESTEVKQKSYEDAESSFNAKSHKGNSVLNMIRPEEFESGLTRLKKYTEEHQSDPWLITDLLTLTVGYKE